MATADFDTYRTWHTAEGQLRPTKNGGILHQRAFLRKYIEIIKTLNYITLNQYKLNINQV